MSKKNKQREMDQQEELKEKTDSAETETKETPGPEEAESEEMKSETKEEPKKADKKDKKSDESAKKIAELSDQIKRNMAEFDNYRKRTEKEKASRFEMGQRSVIEKILPVIDNFERGIATLSEEEKEGAFASGMIQTCKQMLALLSELGVKPIEAVGQPFNPDFHNAVMHVDDESQPENTVIEEFQKGYMMGETVVRYSMVKVAN